MMEVGNHSADILASVERWRAKHQRIALVPTMGNLHAGHMALVAKAQQLADRVVVSIFVNPLQFSQNEDLAHYPRTLERDQHQLQTAGVDLLFHPDEQQMYPRGRALTTLVEVPGLSTILCGKSRPNHFVGVTTIVNKLLHIIPADIAVFGEKDYQQLVIIQQMVSDLNLPTQIISQPTHREADGLAMSSRNQYLSPDQRRLAPQIYQILQAAKQQMLDSVEDYAAIMSCAERSLIDSGIKPEYIVVRRAIDLGIAQPHIDRNLRILVAGNLGNTRLIDNVSMTLPSW